MMKLAEPYKKRPIRFVELLRWSNWVLKVYGITYEGELPDPALVEAAKKLVTDKLPPVSESVYGAGFLGIHDGRGVDFVFLDWWQDENELHHHVFTSPKGSPELLEEKTQTGLCACVWDMKVMCFERQAWLESILCSETGPDIEKYLNTRINEDV